MHFPIMIACQYFLTLGTQSVVWYICALCFQFVCLNPDDVTGISKFMLTIVFQNLLPKTNPTMAQVPILKKEQLLIFLAHLICQLAELI